MNDDKATAGTLLMGGRNMNDDKATASWTAMRSGTAVKPFGDKVKKLCTGNAVPGVLVRMYSDDDAERISCFSIRIEDAAMLGSLLAAHGSGESFTAPVCVMIDHANCAAELRVACGGDGGVVVESKRDGRFLFSDDCARQLGRTLLVLAFPDNWHFSDNKPAGA